MSDRYRIIEYRDDNGATFYTIQIEVVWFFGLKHWRTLKSYSASGEYSYPKSFDTLEEARKFIRGTRWTRKVVEEGIV
jgi:hypothetical protein